MKSNVPPYEITTYPINPPVGDNHFGAKAIVPSSYATQPDDPWNKEFWGTTEQEAHAKVRSAIDEWVKK